MEQDVSSCLGSDLKSIQVKEKIYDYYEKL